MEYELLEVTVERLHSRCLTEDFILKCSTFDTCFVIRRKSILCSDFPKHPVVTNMLKLELKSYSLELLRGLT